MGVVILVGKTNGKKILIEIGSLRRIAHSNKKSQKIFFILLRVPEVV